MLDRLSSISTRFDDDEGVRGETSATPPDFLILLSVWLPPDTISLDPNCLNVALVVSSLLAAELNVSRVVSDAMSLEDEMFSTPAKFFFSEV